MRRKVCVIICKLLGCLRTSTKRRTGRDGMAFLSNLFNLLLETNAKGQSAGTKWVLRFQVTDPMIYPVLSTVSDILCVFRVICVKLNIVHCMLYTVYIVYCFLYIVLCTVQCVGNLWNSGNGTWKHETTKY